MKTSYHTAHVRIDRDCYTGHTSDSKVNLAIEMVVCECCVCECGGMMSLERLSLSI